MRKPSQGDFEEFTVDAHRRLWRAYLPVRGIDGADEAAAEAMAWAWENWARLQPMENQVGYLYRVGLTRSIPRKPLPIPMDLPEPAAIHLPEIEPGLLPALLDLSENQRAAVWLVHACGWSYGEVAEALEIGKSTVGTHVTRALAALRQQLEVSANG